MDLREFLIAIQPQLEARSNIDAVDVSLWEGGVHLQMQVDDEPFGLRFRPRTDGNAYGHTASTTVALHLPPGATLSEGAEKVAKAVLAVIDKVDDGDMVVPGDTREENDPDVGVPLPVVKDRTADQATEGVDAANLCYACVADQRDILTAAGLVGGTVVTLDEKGFIGGRSDGKLTMHLLDAQGDAVWLDAREASASTLVRSLGTVSNTPVSAIDLRVHARQLAHVPKDAPVRRIVVDGRPALDEVRGYDADVIVLLPGTLFGEPDCTEAIHALHRDGVTVLLTPDGSDQALDALAEAVVPVIDAIAVTGLPACVLPAVPHLPLEAGFVWGAFQARVWTDVCGFCDAQAQCPGVPKATFEAWGMRGVRPIVQAVAPA